MVKHAETHPTLDVDGCFGCKAAGVSFTIPAYMSAKTNNLGMSGIEEASQMKQDITQALRNDSEGRFVKA